jgi:N-acetylmuramoyl-L-alanine amidase
VIVVIRSSTRTIAIHCSATRPSQDVGAADIRRWHKNQGWADIGYHYVIRRDGKVERGRAERSVGAHVGGHNATSIGVCMVGGVKQTDFRVPENNFTAAQWTSLRTLIAGLVAKYPGVKVLGHRDYPRVSKACPSFDARAWARREGFPT